MGNIYRATDSALGRPVAIKILADRYAQDEAVRERFTREALAAARLSGDPNTVTIFDVGEYNERPYIVMEHLAGGSLEDIVRKGGAQPPQQVFRWLEQAAAALDAAHAKGVVHRDVKPGNLMLDRNGDVHVADFGIATAADLESLTVTGTVLGTAGYLSPEQAQGQRATAASDRYALAVVAFELLTGTRPFASDSATAEAMAHVNAPVPSVSRRGDLPPELDAVFERALAKDPGGRFETCTDFVAALRAAYVDAAGTTGRIAAPVPAPTAATRALRRDEEVAYAPYASRATTRAWPLLAALLVIGAIAGALLAYFLTQGGGGRAETTVVTRERTVTRQGQVTTVEKPVTITTSASPATSAPFGVGESGTALNDAGYRKMQGGDYAGALPLLERAVQKLQGTGTLTEAYASYNLAYTRFQLGNCDGVLDLLDRAESIEGRKTAIDRLRAQAEDEC
jgi:serine/threonine-protein kinase